jgi:hypothetical protein
MIIDIREVFEGAINRLPIAVTIPANELWQTGADFSGGAVSGADGTVNGAGSAASGTDGTASGMDSTASGITAAGYIENRSGIVRLCVTFTADVNEVCDRCLDTFTRRYVFPCEHILINNETGDSDNDEYLIVDGVHLNLTETAVDEFLLMRPAKILCKEDCLGLDPETGVNLNGAV